MCGPENNDFLYGAASVDCFRPNYDNFPNFRKAKCYLDIAHEGELLFYPRGYWHQVCALAMPPLHTSTLLYIRARFMAHIPVGSSSVS